MVEEMVFTHQDVFHSTCMFNILYNTFFFKALNFFIKMAKNKIPEKKGRRGNFFQNAKKNKHNVAFWNSKAYYITCKEKNQKKTEINLNILRIADAERNGFVKIIPFESHSLSIKCKSQCHRVFEQTKKISPNNINIILSMWLFQLHQFKFEHLCGSFRRAPSKLKKNVL